MRNYYLIGTKYGKKNDTSILVNLIKKNVVSLGFEWNRDLTNYYNGNHQELNAILKDVPGIRSKTPSQIIKFLSMKPGDLIALKGTGSPKGSNPRLDIVGYAIVVSRNGTIYKHEPNAYPEGLGHTINVEFLETNIHRFLPLGYGHSVHKLTIPDHINLIFGEYAKEWAFQKPNSGSKKKNTKETRVITSASYIRSCLHNKIQQDVYEYLLRVFGNEAVKMEVNFIDIIITGNDFVELIEVKPFNSVVQCVRDGLGQLIDYYYRHHLYAQNVTLKIIGYSQPTLEEKEFIQFVKSNLIIPFEYDSWERLKKEF